MQYVIGVRKYLEGDNAIQRFKTAISGVEKGYRCGDDRGRNQLQLYQWSAGQGSGKKSGRIRWSQALHNVRKWN